VYIAKFQNYSRLGCISSQMTEKFHEKASQAFKKIGLTATFEVIKKPEHKYDLVFSATLFRLPDPYKKDEIYTDGLKNILECFPKQFKNMCVRLYIDNSFLEKDDKWNDFYDFLMNDSHTELIKYDFQQFKETPVFHNDMFGTLTRTISLFNFHNMNETVVLIDTDYHKNIKKTITEIQEMLKSVKKNFNSVLLYTYPFEFSADVPRLEVFAITEKHRFIQRFIMCPLIVRKKIDKSVLLDFLHCVYIKCNSYNEWIQELISSGRCELPDLCEADKKFCDKLFSVKKSKNGIFVFGIDEYFINKDLLEYFLDNKKLFYIYYTFPTMSSYNYFLYEKMFKKHKISSKFMNEFYQRVLETEYENDIHKNFKTLDKMIYSTTGECAATKDITAQKRVYDFLCENIKTGELQKNMKLDEKKMIAYGEYFSMILTLDFDAFLQPKQTYKITYSKSPHKYIFTP
jgi:hypothetical protein